MYPAQKRPVLFRQRDEAGAAGHSQLPSMRVPGKR